MGSVLYDTNSVIRKHFSTKFTVQYKPSQAKLGELCPPPGCNLKNIVSSSESEKDEEFEAKSEGRLECGGRVGGLVTAQAKSENHSAQRIPYFETPVT